MNVSSDFSIKYRLAYYNPNGNIYFFILIKIRHYVRTPLKNKRFITRKVDNHQKWFTIEKKDTGDI